MSNTRNLGDIGRNTTLKNLGGDNLIINGNFDIWQRGTSSTASAYGTADRWAHFYVGGTVTTSRQSFSVGDKLGSNAPKYFLRQEVSGQTTGDFAAIQQRIESVYSYSGETITVLGWARRSSGSGNPTVTLTQHFGTGGSPSSDVEISGESLSLTSSWSPFAVTFNIPSISGKTLGSDNNDYLNLMFLTSNLTVGVDYWGIHIRKGTHAIEAVNSYTAPSIADELAKCQRFYQVIPQSAAIGTTVSTSAGLLKYSHAVEMRANPSRSTAATITVDFFGSGQSTTSSYTLYGDNRFTVVNFNSASPARTAFVPVSLLNDITLDAEL